MKDLQHIHSSASSEWPSDEEVMSLFEELLHSAGESGKAPAVDVDKKCGASEVDPLQKRLRTDLNASRVGVASMEQGASVSANSVDSASVASSENDAGLCSSGVTPSPARISPATNNGSPGLCPTGTSDELERAPTTKHKAWCERLVAWRRSNGWKMPVRNSTEHEEAALALWVAKTKIRCSQSLGSEPSTRQLTADEEVDFDHATGPSEKAMLLVSASGEAAMPDIMRIWHGQILPGAQVFVKAVWEEFVTSTAAGEKFFECSNAKNMFRELDAGDLLLLVQTRSQQRVAAVAEVAHPAVSREKSRAVLYDRLPRRLHGSLNAYLDRADAFDYVQFKKVYDLTDCNLKLQDVLAHGGFCMDPRKNLGMGVLKVVETTDSNSLEQSCE